MNSIIYEDESVLVYNKPAGLAVQTKKVCEPDLESEAKNHILRQCPGKAPYLGIVHRLDQPVEGAVLFAKTPGAASFLCEKIGCDEVIKRYAAVVEGVPGIEEGELIDYIVWDGRSNMSKVAARGEKKAAKARLTYKLAGKAEYDGREVSLLDIRLYTGRHHQIRVQLSHMGCPIIGDRKYNKISPDTGKVGYPALAAYGLSFPHPYSGETVEISIKPMNPLFDLFNYFS